MLNKNNIFINVNYLQYCLHFILGFCGSISVQQYYVIGKIKTKISNVQIFIIN